MKLPEKRVGSYVRALGTGLNQLAPHGDFVPLLAGLAHLRALDPKVSGDQLAPAEIDPKTGMPAFQWMQRAIAEQTLAGKGADPSEADIERARRLDPDLARRLACRRALRVHARENPFLPVTHLECALRRMGTVTEITAAYDRLAPDGRWLRIRFIVRGPGGVGTLGPFQITKAGKLTVDPLLQHLLTRHFATPLTLLRDQLGAHTACDVVRLSRGWVGPFWFPGIELPAGIPEVFGTGLMLQLSTEVMAEDIHHSAHLDPWMTPPEETVPEGQKVFRERRFAASSKLIRPLTEWCAERGVRCPITPIEGRARSRTL